MEYTLLTLALVSALIHPLRDLLLKGAAHPTSCYTGVAFCWLVLSFFQSLLLNQSLIIPLEIWPLVIISASGLTIYYYGTLSALARGNLSVYYPIVRASPIAIVIFGWLLFDQTYSLWSLIGILLILLGSFMIQKPSENLLQDPRALTLAICALLASAAYAMADALAMQVVQSGPFLFYTYIIVCILLASLSALENRQSRSPLMSFFLGWQLKPTRIILAGIVSYFSYLLILTAFQFGGDAAEISSLRQFSILISVILAAKFLKEDRFLHRLGWGGTILAGITCIAVS